MSSTVKSMVEELIALGIEREGSPVLAQRSEEIDFDMDDVLAIRARLVRTMESVLKIYDFTRGFGLAAPQIGISKRAFVFGEAPEHIEFVANPKVVWASPVTIEGYEGCLCNWEWRGKVLRPKEIELEFYDGLGKLQARRFSGEMARLVCHEIDHLDGTIYTDKLIPGSSIATEEYMQKKMTRSALR